MKTPPKKVYPLVVVLAALSIIEVAMTTLYPKLASLWERIPILALIITVPVAVVSSFIYLWVRRPGHLYPPSEFGTGNSALQKMLLFDFDFSRGEENKLSGADMLAQLAQIQKPTSGKMKVFIIDDEKSKEDTGR